MQMHIDFMHMHYNRPRFLSIVLHSSTQATVNLVCCSWRSLQGRKPSRRDQNFNIIIRSIFLFANSQLKTLVHKALKKNRIISIRKQLRDRELNSSHKDMVKIKCFLQIRRRRQHFHTTSSTNQAFG